MSELFQPAEAGPDGHWVSVSDLAKIKGISRQTASEKVGRLEKEGRLTTRMNGRLRMVELATYDRIVGQVGDGAREIGQQTRRGTVAPTLPGTGTALRDSQADKALYEAKLKALDFGERTGQLLPLQGEHGLEAALVKVSDKIVRDLGAPMNWVTDLMDAARNGEPALRRVMQGKIRELRKTVAEHLMALAGEAAEAERAGIQIDIHFEGDD